MKLFKTLALTAALLMVAACSNVDKNLQEMIPADATGVVSIDVPAILKAAGVKDGDKITLPASLRTIVDDNDDNLLCQLLTELPHMGIDTDSHCYIFLTSKTFGQVTLVPLIYYEKAMDVIERRTGADFAQHEGLYCLYTGDLFVAVKDNVLMLARVNRMNSIEKLARTAAGMYAHTAANITSNQDISARINADDAVNVYLTMAGLKSVLNRSETYRELAQKMPLLDIIVESDVKAFTAGVRVSDDSTHIEGQFIAPEGSDYERLLTATLSAPGNEVLAAIPSTMEYIASMSVRGEQFAQLPQIMQLTGAFKSLPYIGRIDIDGILRNIDGPCAVGLAHDPTFDDDWNAVIAARTSNAQAIVAQISAFASAMGQAPEVYDGEYIYQYENKMIKVGTTGSVLYVKMLNYEQTEGYANDIEAASRLFAASPIAFYAQPTGEFAGDHITLGFTDHTHLRGTFLPAAGRDNATLELLRLLCSIKAPQAYDNDIASSAWDNVSGLPTSNH